jgi:hypothetical protein
MDLKTKAYINELKGILACDQSDGYLKEWARERLERMNNPFSLVSIKTKRPVTA